MIKTICDICKKDILLGTFSGGVMRNKDVHTLTPFSSIIPNMPAGANIEKKILTEVWDLCEDCQKWIWERIEIRKKEFKTIKTLIVRKT